MPDGERVKVPYPLALVLVRSTVGLNLFYMRTKRERKAGIQRPPVRSLKIQPKIRDNQYSRTIAPEIKLCGNWLEELGFRHGKRVVVTTMKELLIIRLQSDDQTFGIVVREDTHHGT